MAPPPPSKGPPWRKRLVIALLVLVVASVIARVATARPETARPQPAAPPVGASALVAGKPPPSNPPEERPVGPRAALPYVTEGGIAMLLGIGLGIATRGLVRVALVLLAVLFVVIQYLAVRGVLTVDWGAAASWLARFVLNVSSDKGVGAVVQGKLPSAASLFLGMYLGMKR